MAKFLIQYTAHTSRDGAVPFHRCTDHESSNYNAEEIEVEVEAGSELEAVNNHFSEEWGMDPLTREQLDQLEMGELDTDDYYELYIEDFSVTEI